MGYINVFAFPFTIYSLLLYRMNSRNYIAQVDVVNFNLT
nr:ORF10 protein [Severe acute respiratory syndrome coronavirus 2]UDN73246.1 ORF10 protein [Severe acute respiratory syndrome coronavirus 2]UEF92301.1 ORF10 protein [Severe acute respiratory syndrome coronavirus 2]UEI16040.1 ORF10 protein [Severe acute respiratory syndrome coronavirus 2]UEI16377.1 ORF10 protein [Severe acute respiratory syndrome coronavirus 2]